REEVGRRTGAAAVCVHIAVVIVVVHEFLIVVTGDVRGIARPVRQERDGAVVLGRRVGGAAEDDVLTRVLAVEALGIAKALVLLRPARRARDAETGAASNVGAVLRHATRHVSAERVSVY